MPSLVAGDLVKAEENIDNPHLWSAEDPYLYDFEIEALGEEGGVLEIITQKVGRS